MLSPGGGSHGENLSSDTTTKTLVVLAVICLTVGVVLTVQAVFNLQDSGIDPEDPEVQAMVSTMVEQALVRDARNIARARDRIAASQSAVFIDQNMPLAPAVNDAFELLDLSLRSVDWSTPGLSAEFGVYSGRTVNFIAERIPHQTVHGFDSFEGLPEDWRTGFRKGMFDMDGLPKVRTNVKLHKGWFDASVPTWKAAHQGTMKFMHMDADLYSSTKTVLDVLADRIVPGTVIQFDEFYNYPGWQQGEYKAFMEFVDLHQLDFAYIGYAVGGNAAQVAVQISSVAQPASD